MRAAVLLTLTLALVPVSLWSLTVGSTAIGWETILEALLHGGDSHDALLVNTVRLPRLLAGLAVGAGLAACGAILQLLTRNPLADPGLLGVNAGAALSVVVLVALAPGIGRGAMVPAAFGGALVSAVAVHLLGASGRRGPTPLRLTLAGVVVASLLHSATSALLIFDAATLDAVRQWTAGTLSGQDMAAVTSAAPWLIGGLAATLLCRRQIAIAAMGEEVATGLGVSHTLWWGLGIAIAALLSASAVALAGPVGFVGLVIPHVLRLVLASDGARILPLTIPAGALAVVLADTLPRACLGRDIPVGVALALIGGPVFLWMARSRAARLA